MPFEVALLADIGGLESYAFTLFDRISAGQASRAASRAAYPRSGLVLA